MTSVPGNLASADQSSDVSGLVGFSWPVTRATALAKLRWVTGMPEQAAAPEDEGIAPLEPHNPLSRFGAVDHDPMNMRPALRMNAGQIVDADALGGRRGEN